MRWMLDVSSSLCFGSLRPRGHNRTTAGGAATCAKPPRLAKRIKRLTCRSALMRGMWLVKLQEVSVHKRWESSEKCTVALDFEGTSRIAGIIGEFRSISRLRICELESKITNPSRLQATVQRPWSRLCRRGEPRFSQVPHFALVRTRQDIETVVIKGKVQESLSHERTNERRKMRHFLDPLPIFSLLPSSSTLHSTLAFRCSSPSISLRFSLSYRYRHRYSHG